MLAEEIERVLKDKDLSDEFKRLLVEDHLKRQAESRSQSQSPIRTALGNGPLLALLASIAAALVSGIFAYGAVLNEASSTQSLERQKFEYELVKTALGEQKTPEERKKALEFFQAIGLFQLLKIGNVPSAELPSITVTDENLFTIENLYPETAATIGLLLSEARMSADSRVWKKFWHLYRVDLIGVESQNVARAMVAFGRELTALSESGAPPSPELRRLGQSVVQQMAAELPAIQVFLAKMAD